eukprot:jgi/Tetstr1/444147/TSEL_032045.t1
MARLPPATATQRNRRPLPLAVSTTTSSRRQAAVRRLRVLAAVDKEAVVVGGGPAGLSSAMMLAARGWRKVTVLEGRDSVTGYDPSLGFVYMIDGRGQDALRGVDPSLVDDLAERAAGKAMRTEITVYKPDGTTSELGLDTAFQQYWIARYEFMAVLYNAMMRLFGDSISLVAATRCTAVEQDEGGRVAVHTQHADGGTAVLTPDLVIGADGINSAVRKSLESKDPDTFGVEKRPSASAGLQYKVLSLPLNFALPDGKTFPLQKKNATSLMALQGALKGNDTALRLGFLPTNPDTDFCTANIIRYPSHKIWSLKTGEELTAFLEKSFPQLDIRKVLDADEAERYATARPGSFPAPQYCRGLQKVVPSEGGAPAQGVLLLGDAAHAFPPDLGQGVNSALQDVKALGKALEASGDDLAAALPAYEAARLPENKALIRCMQLGGPFQYKQNALKATLEQLNLGLRLLLNKVCPALFDKNIFLMVSDPRNSYTEILRRADRTTRNIYAVLGCLVAVVLAIGRLAAVA